MSLVVGSAEWIAERRNGLGGTDLPKILGVSRFGSAMDVYLDKRGMSAPLVETEAMRWGNILEEPVAREYAVKTGRLVRRAAGFIRHPSIPYLYANIDRWSDQKGTPRRVLEIKTAGEFSAKDFGEEHTDQVPPDYLIQVMHYLSVTGKEQGDLAVLVAGQRHRVYEIARDDELIEGMTEIAAKFWSDTQAGRPPEIDGSEGSSLYLAHEFRDRGTQREMDDILALLAVHYASLTADVKAREEEKALVGNKIRALMGDNRVAEGGGVRVVYSERAGRTTTDWEGFLKAQGIAPSTVDPFRKVAESTRTLTVTVTPP